MVGQIKVGSIMVQYGRGSEGLNVRISFAEVTGEEGGIVFLSALMKEEGPMGFRVRRDSEKYGLKYRIPKLPDGSLEYGWSPTRRNKWHPLN